MGELVGIVPRKLDVSTLLNVVRKYVDIKDEEALKREFAAALNPETEEEKSDNVKVLDHVLPWEDAIQTVAKPLLDRGDITERYVKFSIFYTDQGCIWQRCGIESWSVGKGRRV